MPIHALVLLAFCVPMLTVHLYAENQGQGPNLSSPSSNAVKIFDDGVFNLSTTQPPATSGTRSTPKGNTFYSADDPNYTTDQYARWKTACDHLIDNMQKYRDCFDSEKRRDLAKGAERSADKSPTRKQNSIERVSDPYDGLTEGSSGARSDESKADDSQASED